MLEFILPAPQGRGEPLETTVFLQSFTGGVIGILDDPLRGLGPVFGAEGLHRDHAVVAAAFQGLQKAVGIHNAAAGKAALVLSHLALGNVVGAHQVDGKNLIGLHIFDGAEIVAVTVEVDVVGIEHEACVVLVHGPHDAVGGLDAAHTALAQANQLEADAGDQTGSSKEPDYRRESHRTAHRDEYASG